MSYQINELAMDWASNTTKKHIAEAESAGLILIGDGGGIHRHLREYKFKDCGHKRLARLNNVRNKNVACLECLDSKLRSEAKESGLELLGQGKSSQYRTYKFINCGHQQELRVGHVRGKRVRCAECLEARFNIEASRAGLTIVGKGRSANYRKYRFESCGHLKEICVTQLRKSKSADCDVCFQARLVKAAESFGVEIRSKATRKAYYICRCLVCSCESEIRISHLWKGTFRCLECHAKKLSQEASIFGVTLVGLGRNAHKRLYRFNDCGHSQEIHVASVRSGEFVCNTCEETARDQQSRLYLLHIKNGADEWLKLGYTKTMSTRIKNYRLLEHSVVSLIKEVSFETGREAHRREAVIHKKYSKHRLSPKDMMVFHRASGYSECYPMTLLDQLLSELRVELELENPPKNAQKHQKV